MVTQEEFKTFCGNVNIKICTTTPESPWSNGLVECHNNVLRLPVSKIIKEVSCDLDVTVVWAVSDKNSLKNVHAFSLNRLVFGENTNFPNVTDDLILVLNNKSTSQAAGENPNVLQSTRKKIIKKKVSSKSKPALIHATYTSGDVIYNN